MTYTFIDKLPDNIDINPVLISGYESALFDRKEYLFVKQDDDKSALYEIRFEAHCSPFKEAIIFDNTLAVGHEEYFYLFDMTQKSNLLRLEMSGYFGHLYFDNNQFLVACACGLYSINKLGKINWQNLSLGIDGLIVTDFTDNKIYGSGDWDPPGGWKNFILDNGTGVIIS